MKTINYWWEIKDLISLLYYSILIFSINDLSCIVTSFDFFIPLYLKEILYRTSVFIIKLKKKQMKESVSLHVLLISEDRDRDLEFLLRSLDLLGTCGPWAQNVKINDKGNFMAIYIFFVLQHRKKWYGNLTWF